jgi:hypothetical protein
LARLLTRFILDHFVGDGPVSLAGDDTVDEHRGAQVHGLVLLHKSQEVDHPRLRPEDG